MASLLSSRRNGLELKRLSMVRIVIQITPVIETVQEPSRPFKSASYWAGYEGKECGVLTLLW
jgi:hypothetical protein